MLGGDDEQPVAAALDPLANNNDDDSASSSSSTSSNETSSFASSNINATITTPTMLAAPNNNNNHRFSSTTAPAPENRNMSSETTTSNRSGGATNNNNNNNNSVLSLRPLHVVFIHLDWGIGGAEQLMLQLVQASVKAHHKVTLVTTRCNVDHCFAALGAGTTLRKKHMHVWGQWIPATILGGKFHALLSTIRLLYLAYCVVRRYYVYQRHHHAVPDLIVMDVLPTPLPLLQSLTESALLFYCHFPDQLLLQQQEQSKQTSTISSIKSWLQRFYRRHLDRLEEVCMAYADSLAVNSKFTQQTVLETFTQLDPSNLPVLYPALDTSSLDRAAAAAAANEEDNNDATTTTERPIIVSLNRYERKKNLGLVIEAAAWLLKKQQQNNDNSFVFPKFIIAGGYDLQNTENVEYYQELQTMAEHYGLMDAIEFQRSISDAQRNHLLRTATAVVYTPSHEHFGIVPVEAMYAQTPVVAVRSGGPVETIRHGETGYLCPTATADDFGAALLELLLKTRTQLAQMGQAARQHVLNNFSEERLGREWNALVQATVLKGRERVQQTVGGVVVPASSRRRRRYFPVVRRRVILKTVLYGVEAVLTLLVCWMLAYVLRTAVGVLGLQQAADGVWDGFTRWIVRVRQRQGSIGAGDGEL